MYIVNNIDKKLIKILLWSTTFHSAHIHISKLGINLLIFQIKFVLLLKSKFKFFLKI
jgi:hypothetical protein